MSRICNRVAVARNFFIPKKLSPSRDLLRCTKEQLMLATLAIRDMPCFPLDRMNGSPIVNNSDPRLENMYGTTPPKLYYGFPIMGLDRNSPGPSSCLQDAILTLCNNIKSKSSSGIGARHYSTGYPSYHMPQGPGGYPLPFRQENYGIHPGWQSLQDNTMPAPPRPQFAPQYPPAMRRKAEPLNPSNRNDSYY